MTEAPSATPRLSATVLLLRDGADGLEVLMVARHHEIDFASGAYVFPGGKTTASDTAPHWSRFADCPAGLQTAERTVRIAAIREAFEESGLLLARSEDLRGLGMPLVDADRALALDPHRAAVDRGETDFADILSAAGLVLAIDALVPFARWITPRMMPKRFDTYFFCAAAPKGQLAACDGRETTDAVWLRPQEALDAADRGERTIIFPTKMNLRRLAESETVAAALKQAEARPLVAVEPEVRSGTDGPQLVLPEAAGYGPVVEPIDAIMRR